jgi:hypothetical protein
MRRSSVFSIATLIIAAGVAEAQVQGSYRSGVSVETWIERIRNEPDHLNRFDLARRLTYDIRTLKPTLDNTTIDAIASLLGDESDLVGGEIAEALGNIGSPAQRSVAQLNDAFDKGVEDLRRFGAVSPVTFGPRSVDSICDAFEKIDPGSAPSSCNRGSYGGP